ncbi:polyprotein [Turnip rosette virus]|uniref:Polyprotein n=1 Tax=Turnip rosette virus TaxID=218923 RepID=Q80QX7_9VIRU|nr:polyprotein [Turnip rosette virus]
MLSLRSIVKLIVAALNVMFVVTIGVCARVLAPERPVNWNFVALLLTPVLALIAFELLTELRKWMVYTVKEEDLPAPLSLDSTPRFDPIHGITSTVTVDGKVYQVVIQPEYWHLVSPNRSQDGNKETVCIDRMSTVTPAGKEPPSLVTLKVGDRVVGMGSRVSWGGNTYLLTAAHVCALHKDIYIYKNAIGTPLGAGWTRRYGATHKTADFTLIEVPPTVWAKLGVKAASLQPLNKLSVVTVYSANSSTVITSSSSRAVTQEFRHVIIHSCNTTAGTSGSPLYSGDNVVGVHLGTEVTMHSNRACNVGLVLGAFHESIISQGTLSEISADEAADRDYDFVDFSVEGLGRLSMGKGEFYLRDDRGITIEEIRKKGRKIWTEDFDEESDDGIFETLPVSSLNCQRASDEIVCSPSSSLEITNGNKATSQKTESASKKLGSPGLLSRNQRRKERKRLQKLSQEKSPKSQTTPGPKEDQRPKGSPSTSKRVGSEEPKSQMESERLLRDLSKSIQQLTVLLNSREGGITKTSSSTSQTWRARQT